MSESSVKCNNCGQKTTGDHCEWCGYPLTRHGALGRKFYLILALVLALVLTGGTYAYTWTTASGTIGAESAGDIATCEPVPPENQPDWASVVPEPAGTEILRPNAAGDECGISLYTGAACPNHYQNVDEVVPDGLAYTVYAKGPTWERDLYNIADHSVGSGVINLVTVYARAMAVQPPIQTALKIVLKSGVTVNESVEMQLTTAWGNYSNSWATNPDTGGPFIWDEIDSLQVGISLREGSHGKETHVTQVYVVVDYGPETRGEVPEGGLFEVTFSEYYTGDVKVHVSLTNTDNLTKAYSYLNMKFEIQDANGRTANVDWTNDYEEEHLHFEEWDDIFDAAETTYDTAFGVFDTAETAWNGGGVVATFNAALETYLAALDAWLSAIQSHQHAADTYVTVVGTTYYTATNATHQADTDTFTAAEGTFDTAVNTYTTTVTTYLDAVGAWRAGVSATTFHTAWTTFKTADQTTFEAEVTAWQAAVSTFDGEVDTYIGTVDSLGHEFQLLTLDNGQIALDFSPSWGESPFYVNLMGGSFRTHGRSPLDWTSGYEVEPVICCEVTQR